MKAERSRKEMLDLALDRLGNPPAVEMESARERVLRHLQSKTADLSAEVHADPLPDAERASLWRLRQPSLVAAAAVMVLLGLSTTLVRHYVSGIDTHAVLETVDGSRRIEYGETIRSNDAAGAVL